MVELIYIYIYIYNTINNYNTSQVNCTLMTFLTVDSSHERGQVSRVFRCNKNVIIIINASNKMGSSLKNNV